MKHDLIGRKFKVLDHGHVVLLDYMGSDSDIAAAARTSYGGGTRSISDDRKLLRYMMRHRHTSPFEMAEIKLHVHLPIFVERQWGRHRTASWNEISGRYSVLPDEAYLPAHGRVALQSTENKQGSGEPAPETLANRFIDSLKESYDESYEAYHWALNVGISRELARLSLPVATYTTKVWKCDLHNLLHFLQLRLSAQEEIRQYAQVIADIVKELFPITWEAFQDYRLDAVTFTGPELKYLREFVMGYVRQQFPDLSDREVTEFRAKIDQVGHAQSTKEQEWASAGSQS